MDRVIVITGSNAKIPPDLERDLDINVASPILTNLKDGMDTWLDEFYRKPHIPKYTQKTSSPSDADFANAYKGGIESSKRVVSIYLTGILSCMLSVAGTDS